MHDVPPKRKRKHRYGEAAAVYVHPTNAGLPTSSWWTKHRTRAEFDAAVEAERRRMALSLFGRALGRL